MTLLTWLGAVLISCSWLFVWPVFTSPQYSTAIVVASLGSLFIFLSNKLGRSLSEGLRRSVPLIALIAAAQLTATPLLLWSSARLPDLSSLTGPLCATLKLFGFQAWSVDGMLLVQSPASLVPFSCTDEKIGLLPAVWILLAGSILIATRRLRRPCLALSTLAAGTAAWLLVRYVILVAAVLEHPDPRHYESTLRTPAISAFSDPIWQLASFLPLAFVLFALVPRSQTQGPPVAWKPVRSLVTGGAAALTAACAIFAFGYQDPGLPKQGRVVVDERHSPGWATASIPLGTDWYGRDSLYNYATLVQLLDGYFSTSVNTSQPLHAKLLENTDVLVLKTPTIPLDASEIEALEEFVSTGGGLFLIGDHTDLLGMTTNLNAVAERFGIRFRRDAVNRLEDGQFHTYELPAWLRHPVMADVDHLEFMTSCSLELAPSVEAVIQVGNSFSDPADYSAPSFFGNVRPDTEDDFGSLIMAAAAKYGKGRVLAFSDSTIFSSFAIGYPGRSELALGAVDYLNRENESGYAWNQRLGILALTLAGVLGVFFVRSGLRAGLGATVIGALLGSIVGYPALHQFNAPARPDLQPRQDIRTVDFVRDGDWFLPPALVETSLPQHKSFASFFCAVQRLGAIARVLPLHKALESDMVVMINPTEYPTSEDLTSITQRVADGASLLVMDTIWNESAAINSWLQPFDLAVSATPILQPRATNESTSDDSMRQVPALGSPALTIYGGESYFESDEGRRLIVRREFGLGRIVVLVDSTIFSRERLGPQTDPVPVADPRRGLFELEYDLFRWLLRIESESTVQSEETAENTAER